MDAARFQPIGRTFKVAFITPAGKTECEVHIMVTARDEPDKLKFDQFDGSLGRSLTNGDTIVKSRGGKTQYAVHDLPLLKGTGFTPPFGGSPLDARHQLISPRGMLNQDVNGAALVRRLGLDDYPGASLKVRYPYMCR